MHTKFYDGNGDEIIRHERKHGCVLVLRRQEKITQRHFLKVFWCLKHEVEVCGAGNGTCGIPFGRHDEYCQSRRNKHHGEEKTKDISFQTG